MARSRVKSGKYLLSEFIIKSGMVMALILLLVACSKPVVTDSTPEQRLTQVHKDIKKHQYEKAYESLEELRFVTAGTRLGGEVQYLLGETAYKRSKYEDAESHYLAYLNTYPDGPFAEKALYLQAMSKVKRLQKRKLGFFSLKTYIPHDRDISLLREARALFEIYVEKYTSGEWFETASRQAEELRIQEGLHELKIASFYLRKKSPAAARARARHVLEGTYPEEILEKARDIVQRAEEMTPRDVGQQNP